MADPKDIHEAILAFQANPPVLKKDKAAHQSKYADLVQVNEKVLPLLNALGVTYTGEPTDIDGRFFLRWELRHVASATSRTGLYPVKLSESAQQVGSQLTYAARYILTRVLDLAAEDDDDDGAAASNQGTAARASRGNRPAARAQTRRAEPDPKSGSEPEGEGVQRQQRPAAARPPLPGDSGKLATTPQLQKMAIHLGEMGVTDRGERITLISDIIGRPIETGTQLTLREAQGLIQACIDASATENPLMSLPGLYVEGGRPREDSER